MKVRCAHDELVLTSQLKSHPKNRNRHPADQIVRLADILKYQGWRYPVKVSKRSGFVTSGHGRIEAARLNGWDKVPVNYQDYDSEEQEYADVQADNAIASWAELDLSGINSDLGDLGPDFDIDLLGIKDFVLEPIEKLEPQCDEDETPEVPEEPKTKRGDIYKLGRHRLMCGDSTSIDDVEKLMDGEKADMVFTDPPYGMKLDTEYKRENWGDRPNTHSGGNKGNNYAQVIGDHNDFTPELIQTVFAAFPESSEIFLWGADYYAEHIPSRNEGSWIVWDKVTNRHGEESGCAAFHGSNFELCWSKSRHKRELARVMHKGLASVDKDKRVHPTQKPVQLAEWFFERWGKPGDSVADLFGGSGSTLIACEKTNRKSFMMELDPKYCDVIVARWMKYTGKMAYRMLEDGTQEPYGEV